MKQSGFIFWSNRNGMSKLMLRISLLQICAFNDSTNHWSYDFYLIHLETWHPGWLENPQTSMYWFIPVRVEIYENSSSHTHTYPYVLVWAKPMTPKLFIVYWFFLTFEYELSHLHDSSLNCKVKIEEKNLNSIQKKSLRNYILVCTGIYW